jgi:hypothetical protein
LSASWLAARLLTASTIELNRKITITPTDTPLSPFTKTPDDIMSYWLDAATKVTDMTTKAYVAGLNAIVKQQEATRQASLEWLSEFTHAQSDVTGRLVKSSDVIAGDLTEVAKETTKQVARSGVEVASRTRDTVVTTPRPARTATPRPKASTRSKPASANAAQPGPARWTAEAYEALTAVEINEKLPQFSQRELREVKTYEQAHQSRQTVLDKLDSLQGQEPISGYDALNVPEIQKLIAEGDEKVATTVRDYERPRKGRDGVLHAADAKLNLS